MSEEPTKTPEWHYWLLARLPRELAILSIVSWRIMLILVFGAAPLIVPPFFIIPIPTFEEYNVLRVNPDLWLWGFTFLAWAWICWSLTYSMVKTLFKTVERLDKSLPRREKKLDALTEAIEDDAPARLSLPETEDEPTLADIYDDVSEVKRK